MIGEFVNNNPSYRDLLMSLMSRVDRQETVMMTSASISVQEVIDALSNGNLSQPKVCISASVSLAGQEVRIVKYLCHIMVTLMTGILP
mgnify:CR=1 FL=1